MNFINDGLKCYVVDNESVVSLDKILIRFVRHLRRKSEKNTMCSIELEEKKKFY